MIGYSVKRWNSVSIHLRILTLRSDNHSLATCSLAITHPIKKIFTLEWKRISFWFFFFRCFEWDFSKECKEWDGARLKPKTPAWLSCIQTPYTLDQTLPIRFSPTGGLGIAITESLENLISNFYFLCSNLDFSKKKNREKKEFWFIEYLIVDS